MLHTLRHFRIEKLLTLAAASVLWAGTRDVSPPAPDLKECRLKVVDNDWNFGYIPNQSEVTHVYKVKNNGREAVQITDVRRLCGCSAASVKKKILSPGDSTELSLTFSSGHYMGPVSKAVFLESSDSVCPSVAVSFKATVSSAGPELLFEPFRVNFDTIRTLPALMKVKMRNTASRAVSFSILERGENYAVLRILKKNLAPGDSGAVEIAVTKPPPAGNFHTSFTLVCAGPKKSRYTLPIQGCFLPEK